MTCLLRAVYSAKRRAKHHGGVVPLFRWILQGITVIDSDLILTGAVIRYGDCLSASFPAPNYFRFSLSGFWTARAFGSVDSCRPPPAEIVFMLPKILLRFPSTHVVQDTAMIGKVKYSMGALSAIFATNLPHLHCKRVLYKAKQRFTLHV